MIPVPILGLIIAILLLSCGLWMAALIRVAAGGSVLPREQRPEPPWSLLDLILTAFLLVASQSFAISRVQAVYGIDADASLEKLAPEPRAAILLASAQATLVSMGLSVVWGIVRGGANWQDLGWSARHSAKDLGLGLAAFLMLAPPVYCLQWLLVHYLESKHPLIELLRENPDPRFFLVSVFAAVLVAPVAEEYLFRVLLQGWLERLASQSAGPLQVLLGGRVRTRGELESVSARSSTPVCPEPTESVNDVESPRWESEPAQRGPDQVVAMSSRDNPYGAPRAASSPIGLRSSAPVALLISSWPILMSSLLFAAAHSAHGPDPIPLFFLALGLGFVYSRTHRILPCVVVHGLLNSSSLAALWLAVTYRIG